MKNKLASSLKFGAGAALGAAVYDVFTHGVDEINIAWVTIVGVSFSIIRFLVPTGFFRKSRRLNEQGD